MSHLCTSGGQSIGISASTSVLPMNTEDWSLSGWTGWISLQSKGLSRVFSNTTVQNHQFFRAQLSLQSNSHIHTWPQEKPEPWLDRPLLAKVCIVKAIVFSVVIYGCESWTIKKAECQRIDSFELWCWRRLLRVPWTAGDQATES